jgi:hypothetical protein
VDKLAKNKAQLKYVAVFSLVHNLGALYADEGMNSFFYAAK